MSRQAKGIHSRQAHVAIPPGTYEEEFGRQGFYGPVSQLYHTNPPTGWTKIDGPLRPQAFRGTELLTKPGPGNSPIPGRMTLFHNADVSVSVASTVPGADYFLRNADGDELVFIHEGSGTLQTDFGPLPYEPGDYIVIPRGTTTRFRPEGGETRMMVFESGGLLAQPERGLLGRHALYDQTVLVSPEPEVLQEPGTEWEIKVKRLNTLSSLVYPFPPLDVAGWSGDLYVFKLNVRDIRPVMSHRVHLPPSVHTTFQAPGFVICTFLPRPLETDEDAQRVPFYHRNIDYDEVIFYHSGDFFSRDQIGPGMLTLHPQGVHHGPHPKAIGASRQKTHTDEIAVMIDTQRPLEVTALAREVEWADYWQSWQAHDH